MNREPRPVTVAEARLIAVGAEAAAEALRLAAAAWLADPPLWLVYRTADGRRAGRLGILRDRPLSVFVAPGRWSGFAQIAKLARPLPEHERLSDDEHAAVVLAIVVATAQDGEPRSVGVPTNGRAAAARHPHADCFDFVEVRRGSPPPSLHAHVKMAEQDASPALPLPDIPKLRARALDDLSLVHTLARRPVAARRT